MISFNNNIKYPIIYLLLIFAIVLSGCAKEIKGIVATVNNEDIPQEEFDTEFQFLRESRVRQLGEDALTEVGPEGQTLETSIKQNVLDTLIVERLILQDSDLEKIIVTEKEVNENIDGVIESLGGEQEFEEFLESYAMTKDYFTNYTKNRLTFAKHIENFNNSIEITDEKLEDYFNENKEDLIELRARHILLSNEEGGNRGLEALQNGESFEYLALTESKHSKSAMNGGDLGYFDRGEFAAVQEFEKAVFSLEVGEISDLIKTEVGFHIIRLDDRKDTFEELRDKITVLLKKQEYERYVEDLRDKAEIKVYIDIQ